MFSSKGSNKHSQVILESRKLACDVRSRFQSTVNSDAQAHHPMSDPQPLEVCTRLPSLSCAEQTVGNMQSICENSIQYLSVTTQNSPDSDLGYTVLESNFCILTFKKN